MNETNLEYSVALNNKKITFIERLRGKLIVSCQDYVEVMIDAAIRGGASALRVNAPQSVRLARKKTDIPVIACNKIHFPNSDVYITPSIRSAIKLIEAGANAVALDCTNRRRCRESIQEIIGAIHRMKALAIADIHSLDEAKASIDAQADILATTLMDNFDPKLITQLTSFGKPILAEGHIDTPEKAKLAIDAGAWAVCVGSAITRPHLLTEVYTEAIGGWYE